MEVVFGGGCGSGGFGFPFCTTRLGFYGPHQRPITMNFCHINTTTIFLFLLQLKPRTKQRKKQQQQQRSVCFKLFYTGHGHEKQTIPNFEKEKKDA